MMFPTIRDSSRRSSLDCLRLPERRTGGAGRGVPARAAGATLVARAFGAEHERGYPAPGPV